MSQKPTLVFVGQTNPKDAEGVQLRMKFDTPKQGTNANGPWYLYTAEYVSGPAIDRDSQQPLNRGAEVGFFASPTLHDNIKSLGTKAMDVIEVLRMGEGTDTRWYVELVDTSGGPRPAPAQPQPSRPATSSADHDHEQFDDKRTNYRIAMKIAMDDVRFMADHYTDDIQEALANGATLSLNAMAFTYLQMAKETGTDLRAYLIEQQTGDSGEQ